MTTGMSGASRARTHVESHSGGTHTETVNADDISLQLDNSQSSVIYIDIPGMTDEGTAAMLTGEPPLHVEWDHVRQKWAVRKANDEEVAQAKADAEAAATASSEPAASSA
jgi:hypothetical protein